MKLYKMTYGDSAGVTHVEWFGSKGAAVARRNALREECKTANTRGFTYSQDEIDVPKKKEELVDFLTSLTGAGDPAWRKGKIAAVVATETAEDPIYLAA